MPQYGVNVTESYSGTPGLTQSLADLIGETGAVAKRQAAYTPYTTPEGKPIPRLAPFSPATLRAHELGAQEGSMRPYMQQAQEYTKAGTQEFPDNFSRYMNPYQQRVVDAIAEAGNRNFRENLLPSLEAQFVGQGAYGGSRHRDLTSRALRDLQESIAREQGRALAAGYSQAGTLYGQDRARQMEAAAQSGDLGRLAEAQKLADVGALEAQGRAQQEQKQADLNMQYETFLREQQHPWDILARQSNILHGIPMQTGQTTYTQNPLPPQLNTAGNISSLLSQFAGMSAMAQRPQGMKTGGGVRISNRLLKQMGI